MKTTRPAQLIAACFALASFAGAMLVGITVGNPASTVIVRAIAAMLIGWLIGIIVGSIAQQAVDRDIDKYKEQHPITDPLEELEQDEITDTQETEATQHSEPQQATP